MHSSTKYRMPNNIEVNNQYDIVKREGERERRKEPYSKWDEETYTLNNNKLFVFGVATTTTTAI